MSPAHLETVSAIYAAFGRGDTAAILDNIAADCQWEVWADNRAQIAGLPTLQPRLGPPGVGSFSPWSASFKCTTFRCWTCWAMNARSSPRS